MVATEQGVEPEIHIVPIHWLPNRANGPRPLPAIRIGFAPNDDAAQTIAWGLVDTGADDSVFAPELDPQFLCPVAHVGQVHTGSGLVFSQYHKATISLLGSPLRIGVTCIRGTNNVFFGQFQFVVGRDILDFGTLVLTREDESSRFILDFDKLRRMA